MIVFPVDGRRGRHFPEGIEKADRTVLWFDVPFASSRALDELDGNVWQSDFPVKFDHPGDVSVNRNRISIPGCANERAALKRFTHRSSLNSGMGHGIMCCVAKYGMCMCGPR